MIDEKISFRYDQPIKSDLKTHDNIYIYIYIYIYIDEWIDGHLQTKQKSWI